MCAILVLAQGWWSVAGLAADLAGFSLLALDVTRDYGRHRLVEQFRAGAIAAEWCETAPPAAPEVSRSNRGSFLVAKSNAGGNRARGRQPQPIKNKVDSADSALRRLTHLAYLQERSSEKLMRFPFILSWNSRSIVFAYQVGARLGNVAQNPNFAEPTRSTHNGPRNHWQVTLSDPVPITSKVMLE